MVLRASYYSWMLLVAITAGCSRRSSPTISGPVAPNPARPPARSPDTARDTTVRPLTLDNDEEESITLPSEMTDVAIAGNGRYVIVYMRGVREVWVLDTTSRQVAYQLRAVGLDVHIAGGRNAFFMAVRPAEGDGWTLSSRSLVTFEQQVSRPLPEDVFVVGLAAGSDSTGPLYLTGIRHSHHYEEYVNALTLQPEPKRPHLGDSGSTPLLVRPLMSAHGDALLMMTSGKLFITLIRDRYDYERQMLIDGNNICVPAADGLWIYGTLYPTTVLQGRPGLFPNGYNPPAVDSANYLHLVKSRDRGDPSMKGHIIWPGQVEFSRRLEEADNRLVRLGLILGSSRDTSGPNRGPFDRRLHYISARHLLVCFPIDKNQVVFHGVPGRLENPTRVAYFRTSNRLGMARLGASFRKKIEFVCQGFTPTLKVQPTTFHIDRDGELTGTMPPYSAYPFVPVVITITDPEQIIYASWQFMVEVDGFEEAAAAPTVEEMARRPIKRPDVTTAGLKSGEPGKEEEKDSVISMPAPIDEVLRAGNGCYLLLRFKSISKLGLFDVRKARMLKLRDVEDPTAPLAATGSTVLILSPDKSYIERYFMPDFLRGSTYSVPTELHIGGIGTGYGPSRQPLIYTPGLGKQEFRLLQQLSGKLVPTQQQSGPGFERHLTGAMVRITASADGTTFAVTQPLDKKSGFYSILYAANTLTHYYFKGEIEYAVPSADGAVIHTDHGVRNSRPGPTAHVPIADRATVPALRGTYFLGVRELRDTPWPSGKTRSTFVLTLFNQQQVNVPLGTSEVRNVNGYHPDELSLEQRVWFAPDEQCVYLVDGEREKVIRHPFPIDGILAASGLDYLFVVSSPPRTMSPGSSLSYAIEVKSRYGGVKFFLSAAPPGMQVSADGRITWYAPLNFRSASVVVLIQDASGREILHGFSIFSTRTGDLPAPIPPHIVKRRPTRTPMLGHPEKRTPARSDRGEADHGTGSGLVHNLVTMPEPISDIALGGAGRFLIVQFPTLCQLGILDVKQRRLVKFLPCGAEARFTATAEHLLVADPGLAQVSCWNLSSFECEKTAVLTCEHLQGIYAGSGSYGPVLVVFNGPHGRNEPMFLDLQTLEPEKIRLDDSIKSLDVLDLGSQVRVSTNGLVFGYWKPELSPQGLDVLSFRGGLLHHEARHETVGYVKPDANGQTIFTARGRFTTGLKLIDNPRFDVGNNTLPVTQGDLFLHISTDIASAMPDKQVRLQLWSPNCNVPLLVIPDPCVVIGTDRTFSKRVSLDKRIYLLHHLDTLVTIPPDGTQIDIYDFDLEKMLRASTVDYLIVNSTPPLTIAAGSTLKYQMEILSRRHGVLTTLESGPTGATLSKDNLLQWDVPAAVRGEQVFLISVSDASNKTIFHTVRVQIVPPKPVAKPKAPADAAADTADHPEPVFRTWTERETGRSLEAKLIRFEADQIVIERKKDGQQFTVPLSRFSEKDQQYVRARGKEE